MHFFGGLRVTTRGYGEACLPFGSTTLTYKAYIGNFKIVHFDVKLLIPIFFKQLGQPDIRTC